MIRKTNRVLSLVMAAAMMLTNMISPMTVYAEDLKVKKIKTKK